LLHHHASCRLAAEELAGQVDAKLLLPFLERCFQKGLVVADAGVIDEDVESLEPGQRLAHHLRNALGIGNINVQASGGSARGVDLIRQALCAHFVQVSHDNARPLRCKSLRDRAADPAAGAGDNRHIVF
jgi:hypothetical protein